MSLMVEPYSSGPGEPKDPASLFSIPKYPYYLNGF